MKGIDSETKIMELQKSGVNIANSSYFSIKVESHENVVDSLAEIRKKQAYINILASEESVIFGG